MEKIAVHCPTHELGLKVYEQINKSYKWKRDFDYYWGAKSELCFNPEGCYAEKTYYEKDGYTIQSAEEYLKGGGDVGFKVDDRVRLKKSSMFYSQCKGNDGNVTELEEAGWVEVKWDFEKESTACYELEDLILLTLKTKPTIKENEMKRVSVLLINKDTDAVIFNEEMATEFSDADLKVLILLDKSAEIRKSLGKEINVTLLHWEIKTITSYVKPEVK